MNDLVQTPAKGQPLRASWAASVSETVNRHESALSATPAPAWVNRRDRRRSETLRPFTVAGGTDESGQTPAACWDVYIPPKSISYGENFTIAPGQNVTADAAKGDSWYRLASAAFAGQTVSSSSAAPTSLYLVLYRASSGVAAAFTVDPADSSIVGGRLLVVAVAEIWQSGGSGGDAPAGNVARQLLSSNVDVGAQPPPEYGAFRWTKGAAPDPQTGQYSGTVSFCNYQFGRAVYSLGSASIQYGDQARSVFLVIQHSNPSAATVQTSAAGGSSETQSVVPLFDIGVDGDITNDYRGMPVVPVYGAYNT